MLSRQISPFDILITALILGLMLTLSACTRTAPTAAETPDTAAALVEALRAAGAEVETAGPAEQPFFLASGQMLTLNGASVQVFEFPDPAARAAVSATISPSGSTIGPNMISWVDTPHFWASGRLIVLYVGSEAQVADLLTGVLGQPITEN